MTKCKWYHCDNPRKSRGSFCSYQCKNKYYVQKRRIKVKIMSVAYLGGKCQNSDCGFQGPADAYDFHHRDPTQKNFGISKNGHTRSWERTKAELDKCTLLCSRCHRLEHWKTKASRVIEQEVLREMAAPPKPKPLPKPKRTPKPKPAPKPRPFKIEWPSDEELHRLVWEMPRTKLAGILGVSNVAIGKRCKSRGLDQPPRGYWTKMAVLHGTDPCSSR